MSPTQLELGASKGPEKAQEETKPKFNAKEFLEEVQLEYKKITWPSKDQVTQEFIAVLLLVVLISGIVFGLDMVFGFVVDFFRGRA